MPRGGAHGRQDRGGGAAARAQQPDPADEDADDDEIDVAALQLGAEGPQCERDKRTVLASDREEGRPRGRPTNYLPTHPLFPLFLSASDEEVAGEQEVQDGDGEKYGIWE